uniref:palmitoyl-protein hydrolase n=1 Tax=Timema californicum TaxID=61474 RepID=A0A7R9JCA1_TIMCA|nr:unnamed protein product [Timema californicum]
MGDTGNGVKKWVQFLLQDESTFPHIRVVFPTAPFRPYTPLGGERSNVWFDRVDISPQVPEHIESVDNMARELVNLIQQEVSSGVPLNRIIVGGFSMGGAMALHLGYRFLPQVAGVFALSSFLNEKSAIYEVLSRRTIEEKQHNLPPLFMCHGDRDMLVPIKWGHETCDKLSKLGLDTHFHKVTNALHELKRTELKQLYDWVKTRLPPTQDDL